MPEEITLVDGTKREVPTEDEAKAAASRSETRKVQREDAKKSLGSSQKELEETKKELKKLSNKDFNFKKLRDMNDDEKAKLSATELELKKKQEELEESQAGFTKKLTEEYKNEALAVLVGDDKKQRDKVLHNYSRIKGAEDTKEEVSRKMREAYNMLGVAGNAPNPIYQAAGYQGGVSPVSKTGDKVDGDLAKQFGVTDEELKKSNLKKK